jgi:hypothetical protein
MSCHNAILEQAALLLKSGINPDKLSHSQLAAELTNHLIDGVVLIPSALARSPTYNRSAFTTPRDTRLRDFKAARSAIPDYSGRTRTASDLNHAPGSGNDG